MSTYTDTVARAVDRDFGGVNGALSTGLCPGCDECRADFPDYLPDEPDYEIGGGIWTVEALPGETFPDEPKAEAAAREAFEEGCCSGEVFSEASFSHRPCQVCGSHLGGDREVIHWIGTDGKLLHDDGACVDCVLYLANGDEPENWE